MPVCCVCSKSLLSVNGLYHHLNLQHPSRLTGVLKCMETNCLRLTRNWKQLRRHLIRDHNTRVHAKVKIKSQSAPEKTDIRHLLEDSEPETSDANHDDGIGSAGGSFDETSSMPTEDCLRKVVLTEANSFFCKLYANPSLPRNLVQNVCDDLRVLMQNVTATLAPALVNTCTGIHSNEEHELQVKSLLEAVRNPFEETLSTEHRRLKFLRECGDYFEPEDYVVGDRLDDKFRYGRMTQDRVSVVGKYIPVEKTLSKFLSLPGVLEKVKSYHSYLEAERKGGVISNLIQGKLWRQKMKKYRGKFVIPINLFFDDFEVSNPLGSHAGIHKLGAVYYSLPSLPPEYQSSVENVFLALLFHASDRSVPDDGNNYVFHKLIEELNKIQSEGITVQTSDGRSEKVYICVGLLLGDNLGLNQSLGFAGGFRANYFCRHCKVHRDDSRTDCEERNAALRKKCDYTEDFEQGMSLSGIAESSVWNFLSHFHVYENFVVDLMHDILEGVCRTDMGIILHHFVCEKKSFSLASLNSRINSFNYTLHGLKNKPPCFTIEDIQDGNLNMSSTEMLHFTLLLGFYIGDLLEPDMYSDPVWQLYITLREILDIAIAKTLHVESIENFKDLVRRHHRIRVEELKSHLKPKDHFLVHYALVMEMCGPVAHLSAAKFESKHKKLKMSANSTSSRVHITHTIAVKEQLNFCNRVASKRGLDRKLETGHAEYYSKPSEMESYNLISDSLPDLFKGSCLVVPWVSNQGITYRQNSVVAVDLDDELCPIFASIERIILNEKSDICFVCKLFITKGFNENLHAYEIDESSNVKCFELDDLLYPFLVIYHVLSSGQGYVTLRQLL